MAALVAANMFTGYNVGNNDSTVISHLQFNDDTLFMGVKSWANVRALRAVLVLFEAILGLKVNFDKSMLVRINITDSWSYEAATILHCKIGSVLFMYLGLLFGGDAWQLSFCLFGILLRVM